MANYPFYKTFFGSIFVLISLYSNQYKENDLREFLQSGGWENGVPSKNEYDFIVIGSGSSGGIVASKLSTKYNVLLLEKGGDPPPQIDVSVNYPYLRYSKDIAERWVSIKQNNSALANSNGFIHLDQGKVLGGGSSINAMLYNRGHPSDFNNWQRITKDDSWSYENLLKYFKMSENFHTELDNEHLGHSGPIYISKNTDHLNKIELNLQEKWMQAGEELGFNRYSNPNGPQTEGFGFVSESKLNGRRYGTYKAFLKSILDRKTLTIARYSEAKTIKFDENNNAIGVNYIRHGVEIYAKAKREIIISAGTMNTPLILMRSGIGPEDQLKEANIPMKVNSPVGENFQDHNKVFLQGIVVDNPPNTNLSYKDIEDYENNQRSPLSNAFGFIGQAFIVSSHAKIANQEGWPDIQLCMAYNSSNIMKGDDTFFIELVGGRPQSYGSLKLNTKNPDSPLIFDPNYLAIDQDTKVMAEGLKIAAKLLETNAFKSIGAKIDKIPINECNQPYETEEYWECYIKHLTSSVSHPIGSARMGHKNDKKAVVDSQLKVLGVNNLRVIDNSIQPAITNANVNAVSIMIGQKGSSMILEEHAEIDAMQEIKSN